MRFNNKNMTPGQYIKMYRRGGGIKRYQDGSEMEPGMYDPNANIYSPDWQMDENVQLYEEPTEETIPTEETTNTDENQFPFDNTESTEVVCQMCDGGYPVNLPPNPDGTCPPGSTIDDGQTNPCDQNTDDSNVENQDPNNQDPQADVKSGHRQKHGSKGTIPDWLTAFPAGDKGNLLDLALTARSIVNSYKPENYKGGKFSLLNLPTGQEGGEEGGPAPLEADYNFINAGGCQGGGCAGNPYVDSGASAFVGVEGSNLDDALLQGGLKSHVGYTGNSGLSLNASGELGAQTNLMAATEGAMDPELFYKGKLKAGYAGDPIVMGDAQYTGLNIGGYGEYDSNSGMNVGLEGGYGPVSVRGGYNVDTGSPFLGAGLNVKFRDGGNLPIAQTGEEVDYYSDTWNLSKKKTKKILKNFPDMNFETDTIIRAENPSIRAQNAIMEMNANNAGLESWEWIDQHRTDDSLYRLFPLPQEKNGGSLPKAQTGYFDHYEESGRGYYEDPFSFGVGQSYDGEGGYYSKKGPKILTYDELDAYIQGSQAKNPRTDFINSQRPNVILTHDNAPDWFDNRNVWTRVDRPGWEEDVKQKIYSGEWGFNPATGGLVKLDQVAEDRGGGNVDVHPDKKIIATKEYHDAGWTRLPSDPEERALWIQDNRDDIITITWVHQGDVSSIGRHLSRKKITAEDIELGGNHIEIPGLEMETVHMENSPNQDGYFQALTYSGLYRRKSMLSEKGQWEFENEMDYDSYHDAQFKLDSLMSDPNADPLEIINLKLEMLNNPENIYKDSDITIPYKPNQNLMDTTLEMDNTRFEHSNSPILSFQPGGETESDIGASLTLDNEGARPRIDATVPIASTYDDGYRGCFTAPTGELSAACEIEGGVEFDPSTSTITTPDQINEYTTPTGNQPYSDTNVYDADGDGVITPHDALYAEENPLPTEETHTEVIPGTTKNKLSINPTFNVGAKGSLGYTTQGGFHIGGTGRAGIMGTGTQDINPYFSARGDVGYVGDNFSLTGFGEHGNIRGTDVGLRGSASLGDGDVNLFGEGRYNINTGGPSFMAGVRIPFAKGGQTPSWTLPHLQTGGAAQGGYVWEWSPENPDPLLMNNQQMIGPQNQTSAPPNQELPAANPTVPPMQDADNDGISDFVDADSGSEPAYGPKNAVKAGQFPFDNDTEQSESNIEPGTYDPDIYTFNQPELDEAVDTQDDTEYYEPEDTTPPDANDTTDTTEETDPGMDDTTDDGTDDGTDDTTDEVVNPDEGDTSDTQEDDADTSSEDDDSGAVDEGGGGKKKGRGFGETVTKTAENVVKAGKFLNAWMERRNAKKEKEKLMHKTVADNMFEADEADISGQKGDYDTNSGIFRPDDKVSTVRKGRYGGALPQFAGGGYDFGASSLGATRKSIDTGQDAYDSNMTWSEGLDRLQTGLTIGGLTPGWGIAADVPNAFISAGRAAYAGLTGDQEGWRKHTENAAINSASAIPGPVGWTAGGAGLAKDMATYSGLRDDQSLYTDVQGMVNPDEQPAVQTTMLDERQIEEPTAPIEQGPITRYGGDPFSMYEDGGEVIDIDFKTYRELIAAGAELEIV